MSLTSNNDFNEPLEDFWNHQIKSLECFNIGLRTLTIDKDQLKQLAKNMVLPSDFTIHFIESE